MPELTINGQAIEFGGERLSIKQYKSLEKVPSIAQWWNPLGIIDGYFVNRAPDDVAQMNNDGPGGRAGFYHDVGTTNYTIEMEQKFQNLDGWADDDEVYCGAGLLACIDLDNPDLGLGLWYEPWFAGGIIVVYLLGGPPEEIKFLHEQEGYSGIISHRVPSTVIDQETGLFHSKMVVTETQVACYCNGNDHLFTFDIPEDLRGSTVAGATIDMGASNNRNPDVPAILESSFRVLTRGGLS